jgi:RimJ/RimL family protein N-acetyltransferase
MTDEIRTPRLLMRRWQHRDRAPFADINADLEVMRYFPSLLTREKSDALIDRIEEHFAEHGYGLWALEVEGRLLGFTGLSWATWEAEFTPAVEVGWRLARFAWGRGYASEAATAALLRGFQDVDSIVSFTAMSNEPSKRVMQRIGLRHVYDFDHPQLPDQHPLQRHVLYRADRGTWQPRPRLS